MEEVTVLPKHLRVRFTDKQGVDIMLYKHNIPNNLTRERYYFSAKYVEQLARGRSPTSVAKRERFQQFQTDSEGLEPKTLPEGYQSFSREKKQETMKKLIEEIADELTAAAMSRAPVQGVDSQADSSDNLQVGLGSARQSDMTVREDVDMQVNNPVEIQVDEVPVGVPNPDLGNTLSNESFSPKKQQETVKNLVEEIADELTAAAMSRAPVQLQNGFTEGLLVDEVPAGAPNPDLGNTFSNDASLQSVAWNQREPVPVDDLVLILSDIKRRSLGFPGCLPKFEWSDKAFRSFINRLEFLEGVPLEDVFKHSIYE